MVLGVCGITALIELLGAAADTYLPIPEARFMFVSGKLSGIVKVKLTDGKSVVSLYEIYEKRAPNPLVTPV